MLTAPYAQADLFVPGGSVYDGSTFYQVQSILGEGTFGKVAKCTRMSDKATVAVKVIKKRGSYNKAVNEVQALFQLKTLDPDKCNVVRWYNLFADRGCVCLVFEHLDKSLSDFMKQRYFCPLPLKEIRPIVQQLATALDHLTTLGLIHADIKLENVMLVNHEKEPFRVKLIDFSLAMDVSAVTQGSNIQTYPYRSPEIIVAVHFTQAIDMWSLGCLAAALYLGTLLYPGVNDYDMIRYIVETQGQPPDSMLNAGQRTSFFFEKVYTSSTSRWRLKTPGQYYKETGIQPMETRRVKFSSLDGLLNILLFNHSTVADKVVEEADRLMFVDMLKVMLKLDATQRVTPRQVLEHNFIKMSHIAPFCRLSSLANTSFKLMEVCKRTSDNIKAELGPTEPPFTKATCPNQQDHPTTPTTAAHMSKPIQPICINTKPCTYTLSKGSVPPGTKRASDQYDGEKTFPVSRNANYAGPPNSQDPGSNQTVLPRPPVASSWYEPCNERMVTNGEKDDSYMRSEPLRKRVRAEAGFEPYARPTQANQNHPNQQNRPPLHPTATVMGEVRLPTCINPKPCTYSQTNGTAQPRIKAESDHKDGELTILKEGEVKYEMNRDDSTTRVVGCKDSKKGFHP